MSLVETQEIMATLQEIMAMLEGADLKVGKVTAAVSGEGAGGFGGGGHSLRSEFRIMNYYMVAIQRWSGSDTLAQVGNKIQEATMAFLRFQMMIEAFSDIMMATSLNPFMIAYAGAHAFGFAISMQNLMGQ